MEKAEAKISVIIPIYKVQNYLDRCIRSVLECKDSNFEVILVDDGSPDRCPQICDEWAQKDSRIVAVHKKNGGLSSARNAGLKAAAGDYVWFVDSDDYVASDALSAVRSWIQAEQKDMYLFKSFVDKDGEITVKGEGPHDSVATDIKNTNERCRFIHQYLECTYGFSVWNKIFSMKLIRRYQIYFEPTNEIFAEDICFCLYYLSKVKTAQYFPRELYYYALRENSIMASKKYARFHDLAELGSRVIKFAPQVYGGNLGHFVMTSLMIHEAGAYLWSDYNLYHGIQNLKDREYIEKSLRYFIRYEKPKNNKQKMDHLIAELLVSAVKENLTCFRIKYQMLKCLKQVKRIIGH